MSSDWQGWTHLEVCCPHHREVTLCEWRVSGQVVMYFVTDHGRAQNVGELDKSERREVKCPRPSCKYHLQAYQASDKLVRFAQVLWSNDVPHHRIGDVEATLRSLSLYATA